MSLRTVDIVEKYDSGIQNVVEDFYLPVLKESINYDRIAGFFTSTSLLVSFRGLESLVKNKGKVRLIVSPRLSDDDIEIMNSYEDDIEKYIEMNFEDELQKVENGIAVEERLPEDNQAVLTCRNKHISILIWKSERRIWLEPKGNWWWSYCMVEKWLPLPELYSSED